MARFIVFLSLLFMASLLMPTAPVNAEAPQPPELKKLDPTQAQKNLPCDWLYFLHNKCSDTCDRVWQDCWLDCLDAAADCPTCDVGGDDIVACREECDQKSNVSICIHDQCDCRYFSKRCPDPEFGLPDPSGSGVGEEVGEYPGPTGCPPELEIKKLPH